MKVGLRNHEIDKMRGDLEHIPENEDEFIEALMQGNSDKIFLLQLRWKVKKIRLRRWDGKNSFWTP